jgi:hypothetical protein
MAIDYTRSLVHKGALLALEATLKAAMGNLNTALSSDTNTAFAVATGPGLPGPMLAAHTQIGDLAGDWTLPADGTARSGVIAGGAFRIRVCMPMGSPGFSASRRTQSPQQGAGISITLSTDIYVYAHQDLWRNTDKDVEARNIVLVEATVEDWARTTLNQNSNRRFYVPSFEFGNPTSSNNGNDYFSECMVTSGSDGFYPKSIGSDTYLHALHLIHSGTAAV